MTGNFGWLALAAAFLLASHFGVSSTGLRTALVRRIGERAYTGVYSIVALGAMVWLVRAYAAAPYEPVWFPSAWMWLFPLVLMPLALLLLVGGVSTSCRRGTRRWMPPASGPISGQRASAAAAAMVRPCQPSSPR